MPDVAVCLEQCSLGQLPWYRLNFLENTNSHGVGPALQVILVPTGIFEEAVIMLPSERGMSWMAVF